MKKLQQTRDIVYHTLEHISGKTLDLGAGMAKYRDIIRPKTSEYITFDVVPGDNIDVVGDVLDMPFENGTFDTILSTQVLEHVEKPWIMIEEIHRTLNKNGVCILTAPFLIPYHADPHDFFRYTAEGLKSLFTHAGFEIIKYGGYGSTFTMLAELSHFLFFNPYTKKATPWSDRAVRYTAKIARIMDKKTKNKIVYPNSYIVAKKP